MKKVTFMYMLNEGRDINGSPILSSQRRGEIYSEILEANSKNIERISKARGVS